LYIFSPLHEIHISKATNRAVLCVYFQLQSLSKGCIRLEDALSDWECSCTFTTVITAAGSAVQIDGTTGFGLGDVCKSLLTSTPPDYIKFWECLSSPEAGPVVVENWWFNPDVPLSAFVFEEDSVCGIIDGTELGSSTGFQLWEPKYKNLPLGQFTEVGLSGRMFIS
jgi:hypothetical protein